jgi:transposase InsO family protein
MWRENRLWGENRIAGELAKLGWRVSPRTVAKYRPKHLGRGRGQHWRTFLRNHASQVWACDFFTVATVHFHTLYAFVVVSLERRRIVHVGVTAHPTGAWVAQRMIEAVGDAPSRFLLRDRDSIYDARFRRRLRGLGVRGLLSPPRAPLANASASWGRSVETASITYWSSANDTPSASCASTSATTTAGRIAACAPSRTQARAGTSSDVP